MYSEYFQQATDFNNNLVEPLRQANAITSATIEKIAQNQIKMGNDFLGASVGHLQNLTGAKKVEEVIGLHTKYLGDIASKCAEYASQLLESTLKASAEYSKLFDEQAKTLTEKSKAPFGAAANSSKSGKAASAA